MTSNRPFSIATRCNPRVISAKYGSETSCTITPTALRWARASDWACAFGTYRRSSTALSTRTRRSSATCLALPLMTREAVAGDTFARRATSARVTVICGALPMAVQPTGFRVPDGLAVQALWPLRCGKRFPCRAASVPPAAVRKAAGQNTDGDSALERRPIGIIVNGVTGRMGYRQHLVRSLLAIRDRGGLALPDGRRLWPEPILVGRSATKLRDIAERHGLTEWTTDLTAALARPDVEVYFDAQVTSQREKAVRAAIDAGKHVYTEKPTAPDLAAAVDLARSATAAGIKHGVVQDKLFLPGLRKLARLVKGGFFGRILSVRGEFGYWVFEGDWQEAQRPSWNYRAADGGGIVVDMFPHWQYILEQIFGRVTSVQATIATHIPTRVDEQGLEYEATAADAAYGIFELDGGAIAQINSSWAVRVYRDELVEFQVDGTHGSAVAGLRECRIQHRGSTPKPVWNPDLPATERFRDQWQVVPDNADFDNGFKVQWEAFLRHVVEDGPFPWDFGAGARGVQLAELGLRSAREGCRLEIPELQL